MEKKNSSPLMNLHPWMDIGHIYNFIKRVPKIKTELIALLVKEKL
jgi:hypothetical protein